MKVIHQIIQHICLKNGLQKYKNKNKLKNIKIGFYNNGKHLQAHNSEGMARDHVCVAIYAAHMVTKHTIKYV